MPDVEGLQRKIRLSPIAEALRTNAKQKLLGPAIGAQSVRALAVLASWR
jgi:hypothetical protein